MIDLQHVKIFAALRFRVACPNTSEQAFYLQAGRCSRSSIFSRTVERELNNVSVNKAFNGDEIYLLWMLLGGVFVSITQGPTGVLGFVFVFPDKHVEPIGEHARRFDFLYERFRNKSLQVMKVVSRRGSEQERKRRESFICRNRIN